MYELLNSNLELLGYGSYSSLKMMAAAEHLLNYMILPAFNGSV